MKLFFGNQYLKILSIFTLTFFIMMSLRLFFYFKYIDYFSDLTTSELLLSFLYGFRVDTITIFTFLGIFALLLALPMKFNKSLNFLLSILFSIIFFIILLICAGDILYFEFSIRHVSGELLAIADDIDILVDMAFGSMLYYTIGFVIFFMAVLYLYVKIFTTEVENYKIGTKHYVLLIFVIILLFSGIRNSISGKSFGIADAYAIPKTSSGVLALNGFFSFYRTLEQSKKLDILMDYDKALPQVKDLFYSDKFIFTTEEYPLLRVNTDNKIKNKYNI